MKYVGLFKSGDSVILQTKMPAGNTEVARLFPKGSSGSSLWVSGYFVNLSPTFTLHLLFYNSRREEQEVIVDPFQQVDLKSQNVERLIIRTDVDEINLTGFGIWEYVLSGMVAQTDDEAKLMLIETDFTVSPIDVSNRFVKRQLATGSFNMSAIHQAVVFPANSQILILAMRFYLDSSNLPVMGLTENGFIGIFGIVDATVTESLFNAFMNQFERIIKFDKFNFGSTSVAVSPDTGSLEFSQTNSDGAADYNVNYEVEFVIL